MRNVRVYQKLLNVSTIFYTYIKTGKLHLLIYSNYFSIKNRLNKRVFSKKKIACVAAGGVPPRPASVPPHCKGPRAVTVYRYTDGHLKIKYTIIPGLVLLYYNQFNAEKTHT